MPPITEPIELHPVAWMIAMLTSLTLCLICYAVCRHKDLQMRGKRKRGGEYASGGNVNIMSELDKWQIWVLIFGLAAFLCFIAALLNDAPALIIHWIKDMI